MMATSIAWYSWATPSTATTSRRGFKVNSFEITVQTYAMRPKRLLYLAVVPPMTEALTPTLTFRMNTRVPMRIASMVLRPVFAGYQGDRLVDLGRNAEFACDQVPRSRRDDSERDRGPHQTVADVGDRPVAADGHDEIEALAQAAPHNLAGLLVLHGLVDLVLDPGCPEPPVERPRTVWWASCPAPRFNRTNAFIRGPPGYGPGPGWWPSAAMDPSRPGPHPQDRSDSTRCA